MVGRVSELAEIRRRVELALTGSGSSMVVVGEPGVGKSTLVHAAASGAEVLGAQVVLLRGVEAERDVPFAGLHALSRQLDDAGLAPALTEGQRHAALLEGSMHRLARGVALLEALGDAAAAQPVVLVVDDLQWLDGPTADAVCFAARRVSRERLVMLLCRRPVADPSVTASTTGGLDELVLRGLTLDEAQALLPQVHPHVLKPLLEATAGNPLALHEAAARMDPDVASGRLPLVTLPVTDPERAFASSLERLSPDSRRAARLLAAAGRAPRHVVVRALAEANLDLRDLEALESAGLVWLDARVEWRHPLVRAAALRGTTLEVCSAHAALASAHPDTAAAHVWHRARAATGRDEQTADALDRVAERAEQEQALADAADAWEAAARLGETDRLPQRVESAARCAVSAGLTRRGADLLDEALQLRVSVQSAAELLALRGRVEHTLGRPELAWDLFMQAVDLAPTPDLKVRAGAESLFAAMYCGAPGLAGRAATIVERHADPTDAVHRFLAHHCRGAATALSGDAVGSRPDFDAALAVEAAEDLLEDEPHLALWVVNADLFAQRSRPLQASAERAIARLRQAGDLMFLPRILRLSAWRHYGVGSWDRAHADALDSELLSRMSGQATQLAEAALLAAEIEVARGDLDASERHATEARHIVAQLGVPWLRGHAELVLARVLLAQGRVDASISLLGECIGMPGAGADAALDLAENLARRAGRAAALESLVDLPDDNDRALLARVLSDDPDDARHVLQLAADEPDVAFAARLRLSAASTLRRAGQRREARSALTLAAGTFEAIGARAWLARAEEELLSSGATLRRRAADGDALTPSEQRVAALAATGLSNKQVAAQLFLSPKTVEFHLGRAFRKLDVSNRTALVAALEALA